ncbi:MAG: hypothetical protein Alpg2KO_00080 [Alphaproteobacteria bacterium]
MSQRPTFLVEVHREITQTQLAVMRVEASDADVARAIANGRLREHNLAPEQWRTQMLDSPRYSHPQIARIIAEGKRGYD